MDPHSRKSLKPSLGITGLSRSRSLHIIHKPMVWWNEDTITYERPWSNCVGETCHSGRSWCLQYVMLTVSPSEGQRDSVHSICCTEVTLSFHATLQMPPSW